MSQSCVPRGSSKVKFYLIASKNNTVGFKGHMRLKGGKKMNLYSEYNHVGTEHKFMVKTREQGLSERIIFPFCFMLRLYVPYKCNRPTFRS